jgi:3-oxoadipate enol-lactonase
MTAMLPQGQSVMRQRAEVVLASGLSAIVAAVASHATSATTKATSPLSLALIRSLVLATSPEAYAAACLALANGVDPDYSRIKAHVLIVGGEEDYLSNHDVISTIVDGVGERASAVKLAGVGHWHAVEKPIALARLLDEYFGEVA